MYAHLKTAIILMVLFFFVACAPDVYKVDRKNFNEYGYEIGKIYPFHIENLTNNHIHRMELESKTTGKKYIFKDIAPGAFVDEPIYLPIGDEISIRFLAEDPNKKMYSRSQTNEVYRHRTIKVIDKKDIHKYRKGNERALSDAAESVAGRKLKSDSAGKSSELKESETYKDRSSFGKTGQIIVVQFSNQSGRDILTMEIKRDGEVIHTITGMRPGKISGPIPVKMWEELTIRMNFIERHRYYGTWSKWRSQRVKITGPIVKIRVIK